MIMLYALSEILLGYFSVTLKIRVRKVRGLKGQFCLFLVWSGITRLG